MKPRAFSIAATILGLLAVSNAAMTDERYARGEIDKEEFEEKKRIIRK